MCWSVFKSIRKNSYWLPKNPFETTAFIYEENRFLSLWKGPMEALP